MTLAEFTLNHPQLAYALQLFVGDQGEVDGVYQNGDRWEAHCYWAPDAAFEIVIEARCHPSCVNSSGRQHVWQFESHLCCEACKTDASHRYQTVHE